jgi:hypothetical protein
VIAGLGILLVLGVAVGVVLGRGGGEETVSAPASSAGSTGIPPAPPPATGEAAPALSGAEPPSAVPPEGFAIWDVRVVSLTPFSATIAWRTTEPAESRAAWGLAGGGSTLWGPADETATEHTATIPALSYSTAYTVSLTATRDGEATEASVDVETPPLPANVNASTGGGALLLDGQPFFPLMVWSQCSTAYEANLAAGMNLFAADRCGGISEQLGTLGGRALSAQVAGEKEVDGPAVIGWFYEDEPDLDGTTGEVLPTLPLAPGQVSFLTLSNHFYSGAEALSYGRDMYPGLVSRADMVGFDLYPLQVWCQEGRLGDVYDSQRELVAIAAGKPTYQWIETSGMDCDFPPFRPTPETVRAEIWLAIAGGANGLGIFPPSPSEEVAQTLATIVREIKGLSAALLSPGVDASVESGSGQVRVGARAYNGALYVIAVNPGTTAERATITVPGLEGRTLSVLDENRAVEPDGDTFADDFGPLAAHVYLAVP